MWNHDNFFVGITVALVLTLVTAILIILLAPVAYNLLNLGMPSVKILLLAIAPALIMMRYYFRKLGYGKSGSGVVLVIFIGVIIYFLFVANKLESFPHY